MIGTEFSHLKMNYRYRSNGLMGTNVFISWILKWYEAVRSNSSALWCLLIGNYERYYLLIELRGIEIAFLPSNSTAINQNPDLGLIAYSKICYGASLFAVALEIMETRRNSNAGNRKYEIRESNFHK